MRSADKLSLSTAGSNQTVGDEAAYEKPRLASQKFSDIRSVAEGEAVFRMANHLSTAVSAYDEGRSLDALSFMSQLAELSGNTPEFEGQQRIVEIPERMAAEGYQPDFEDRLRNVDAGVRFQIETADGDRVEMNLEVARGRNGERGLSFSFTVDGQLSDQEKLALNNVGEALGRVANEFFEDGTAGLSQLMELGGKTLRNFSIELQSKEYGELKLSHQRAALGATESLKGEYQGYEFDITRQLGQQYVGGDIALNPQYQSYLSVIEQAARDYDTDADVTRFLKGGMNALFGISERADEVVVPERAARRYSAESAETLSGFYSNLPDFSASFSSPVFVNEYNPAETAYLQLDMQQQTEQSYKESGEILATQRFSYHQVIKTFEALPGMENPDLKGGNYIYQTLERNEEITRALELKADRSVAALEARKGEEKLTREYKENHQLVDVDN